MSVDIAVVILNYNGERHLETYLPSVVRHTPANIARIVILDNGSSDGSIPFVEQKFPNVEVIALGKNYGFAEGYNKGLLRIDVPFYVLLNSDVRVTPDWLNAMHQTMLKDSNVAACQPKILEDNPDKNNTFRFEYSGGLGGWMDKLGYPFAIGRIFRFCEEDTGQYDTPQRLAWCCGAAMMIRRDAYEKAGGMDAYLFAHQEEIDLCWRWSSMGYELWNCPKSVVHHLGGGTLSLRSPYKLFLNVRNNLIVLAKNMPLFRFFIVFVVRLMIDGSFSLAELCKGHLAAAASIWRAYAAFVYWAFFVGKTTMSVKRGLHQRGYYERYLVWDYYLLHKKTFSALRFQKKSA